MNNGHAYDETVDADSCVCGKCGLESCYWDEEPCPRSEYDTCDRCGVTLHRSIQREYGLCDAHIIETLRCQMFELTAIAGIYQDGDGNLAIALTDEQLNALKGQGVLRFARDGQPVAMLDIQLEEGLVATPLPWWML